MYLLILMDNFQSDWCYNKLNIGICTTYHHLTQRFEFLKIWLILAIEFVIKIWFTLVIRNGDIIAISFAILFGMEPAERYNTTVLRSANQNQNCQSKSKDTGKSNWHSNFTHWIFFFLFLFSFLWCLIILAQAFRYSV